MYPCKLLLANFRPSDDEIRLEFLRSHVSADFRRPRKREHLRKFLMREANAAAQGQDRILLVIHLTKWPTLAADLAAWPSGVRDRTCILLYTGDGPGLGADHPAVKAIMGEADANGMSCRVKAIPYPFPMHIGEPLNRGLTDMLRRLTQAFLRDAGRAVSPHWTPPRWTAFAATSTEPAVPRAVTAALRTLGLLTQGFLIVRRPESVFGPDAGAAMAKARILQDPKLRHRAGEFTRARGGPAWPPAGAGAGGAGAGEPDWFAESGRRLAGLAAEDWAWLLASLPAGEALSRVLRLLRPDDGAGASGDATAPIPLAAVNQEQWVSLIQQADRELWQWLAAPGR